MHWMINFFLLSATFIYHVPCVFRQKQQIGSFQGKYVVLFKG